MTSPAPIVAIVGPTASGKSSLADALAMRLGGAVISVDAMQVYRGMDIGTAKTPPAGREAPLLMVDVADVREDYSVQRFQSEARDGDRGLDRPGLRDPGGADPQYPALDAPAEPPGPGPGLPGGRCGLHHGPGGDGGGLAGHQA